ncbi:olfactory receptor 10AG1-like [Lissotriton helveticus]
MGGTGAARTGRRWSRLLKSVTRPTLLSKPFVAEDDVGKSYQTLCQQIGTSLDKLIPLRNVGDRPRRTNAWFTEDLGQQKLRCKQAERLWRGDYREVDKVAYKATLQEYKIQLRKAKAQFLADTLTRAANKAQALFKLVNNLAHPPCAASSVPISQDLCDSVADAFEEKIRKILSGLQSSEQNDHSAPMDRSNLTLGSGFLLLGFSDASPQLQVLLSVMFILLYLMTLLGNLIIYVILTLEPTLHSPMYFFLRHLSLVDICYISTTVPKTLSGLLLKDRHISFIGCVTQMFCFVMFATTDSILLTVMSFDRYVAICIPLRYTTIMRSSMCVQLASGSWIIGIACSINLTSVSFSLPFCRSHEIPHLFCDLPSLMKLACGDTFIAEVVNAAMSVLLMMVPLMLIVISYTFIISKILKIRSTEGRKTAASTCVSHIVSVVLLYGTSILTYSQPKSSQSLGRVFSVFYACLIPMLNPLIYCLRNKEVKGALEKHKQLEVCDATEPYCLAATKALINDTELDLNAIKEELRAIHLMLMQHRYIHIQATGDQISEKFSESWEE